MSRSAIVLGGASSAWDDLAAARAMVPDATLFAVNHAARDVEGPLEHFVTMHSDLLPMWIAARAAAGRPPAGQLWCSRHRAPPKCNAKPIESWGGSSGLLAVKVALDLGFERVILCGVPMEQNGCHYDRPGRRWSEASQYRRPWEARVPDMAGRVRSSGGWTAALLGVPTREWIDGEQGTA